MKLTFLAVLAVALTTALPFAVAQQDTTSQPSAQQPAVQPDATQPSTTTTTTTTTEQQTTTDPSQSTATSTTSGAGQTSAINGTIAKAGDKCVLQTSGGTFQLDNQDKASQFEGKQVTVTGSIDQSTSMIHVIDISPAQ